MWGPTFWDPTIAILGSYTCQLNNKSHYSAWIKIVLQELSCVSNWIKVCLRNHAFCCFGSQFKQLCLVDLNCPQASFRDQDDVSQTWSRAPSWKFRMIFLKRKHDPNSPIIASPSEGPPGCEGSVLSCILVNYSVWIRFYYSLDFSNFPNLNPGLFAALYPCMFACWRATPYDLVTAIMQ